MIRDELLRLAEEMSERAHQGELIGPGWVEHQASAIRALAERSEKEQTKLRETVREAKERIDVRLAETLAFNIDFQRAALERIRDMLDAALKGGDA